MPLGISFEEALELQKQIHEEVSTRFGISDSELRLLGHQNTELLRVFKKVIPKHALLMHEAGELPEQPSQEWIHKRVLAMLFMTLRGLEIAGPIKEELL